MDINFELFSFHLSWWMLLIVSAATAFIITYISIPPIITVSHKTGLYEKKNGRGSHVGKVPTLGGIAVFAGFIITSSIFLNVELIREFQFLLGAIVILFFTGVKDDLLVIDPKKKLFAQVIAVAILVVLGDHRITTFHGFANINEIPYWFSVGFSIFVYIVIINGINLIDGIDGLASGVAIIISVTFAAWFIYVGQYSYAIVPLILAGSLMAFFRFNVFSTKNKIFLGDTGSLIIGLIIASVSISFLEFDHASVSSFSILSAPAITFGVLIIPLFDTLRVFTIRLFGGESPFKADRKHIHHRLIDLGCSHLKATSIIMIVNVLFVAIVFAFQGLGNLLLLLIVLSLASVLSYIPVYLIYKRNMTVSKHQEENKVIKLKREESHSRVSDVV